jgi:hypothetical protein
VEFAAMSYVYIDGVKYEKTLLELAQAHTQGKGEGKISYEEAQLLVASARDGIAVTPTELATLKYIRQQFPFTDKAAVYFDEVVASLEDEVAL